MEGIVISHSVYLIVGIAVWWPLERVLPFRKIEARRTFAFDLACFVASALCFYVVDVKLAAVVWDAIAPAVGTPIGAIAAVMEQLPLALRIVLVLALGDLLFYFAHRLNHSRFFWHTHALHHSAEHLNWLSGYRGTFIHILLMETGYIVVSWFIPLPDNAVLWLTYFYVLNNQVTHSNVKLPWGPLRSILVTPEVHFAHHLADLKIGNTNFGAVFTIWDRLFGTYTDPSAVPENAPIGLVYDVSRPRLALGLPPQRVPPVLDVARRAASPAAGP